MWNVLENDCFVYLAKGSIIRCELVDCTKWCARLLVHCGLLCQMKSFFFLFIHHSFFLLFFSVCNANAKNSKIRFFHTLSYLSMCRYFQFTICTVLPKQKSFAYFCTTIERLSCNANLHGTIKTITRWRCVSMPLPPPPPLLLVRNYFFFCTSSVILIPRANAISTIPIVNVYFRLMKGFCAFA